MLADIKQPKERDLFFTTQVEQSTIAALTQSIIAINNDDDDLEKIYSLNGFPYERKPIRLFIDSYGGVVYQCLGLIGVMEKSKTPIHTIVTGAAMSCGFIMLISGHKRFGYKYSTPLYHQVSSWLMGTVQQIKEDFKETERLQMLLEDITIKKTNIKSEKLIEIKEKKIDWYMSAEEALKLGVIDEIL